MKLMPRGRSWPPALLAHVNDFLSHTPKIYCYLNLGKTGNWQQLNFHVIPEFMIKINSYTWSVSGKHMGCLLRNKEWQAPRLLYEKGFHSLLITPDRNMHSKPLHRKLRFIVPYFFLLYSETIMQIFPILCQLLLTLRALFILEALWIFSSFHQKSIFSTRRDEVALARWRAQGICKWVVKLVCELQSVGKSLFCKELTPGLASFEQDLNQMLLYWAPVIFPTVSFDFNLLEYCLSFGKDSKGYCR